MNNWNAERLRKELEAFQLGSNEETFRGKNPFAMETSEWFFFDTAQRLAIRFQRARINQRLRSMRVRLARAMGRHTAAQWGSLVKEFNGRCVRCGSTDGVTKDHIVPIYRGGSDAIENIQPLCVRCNSSKGPECTNWVEFRRTHGFLCASDMEVL